MGHTPARPLTSRDHANLPGRRAQRQRAPRREIPVGPGDDPQAGGVQETRPAQIDGEVLGLLARHLIQLFRQDADGGEVHLPADDDRRSAIVPAALHRQRRVMPA